MGVRWRCGSRIFWPGEAGDLSVYGRGAREQLDLFDPKPELVKRHGEPVPESLLATLKDAAHQGMRG
ncbi:MAG: hypothetical protein U0992_00395 [Planctomycetaceae bacterium]